MDTSLYEVCAKAVGQALKSSLARDPLRGINNVSGKRAFLKDVREKIRREGYPVDIDADLRGCRPCVTVIIKGAGHGMADYHAVFDSHALTEMLALNTLKVRLPH